MTVIRSGLGLLAAVFATVAFGVAPVCAQGAEEDEVAAREQAVVLYTRAEERYREGDYEAAALLLREAITLHEAAAMHYNLAKALEGLEDLDGAIAAYERFLELAPDNPQRDSVNASLEELRAARAAAESEPEPESVEPVRASPELAPSEPSAPPPERSIGPFIVLGAAALPLGAGIATGVLSRGAIDDARDAPDQPTAKDHADSAERLSLIANLSFALAGALAIAGTVWAIVDRKDPDGAGTTVSVGPGSLELRTRW